MDAVKKTNLKAKMKWTDLKCLGKKKNTLK